MWNATSELHAVTAYRQGERQEVPRQGGHGRRFAFNGQTVNRSPCSAAPIGQSAHQRISKFNPYVSTATFRYLYGDAHGDVNITSIPIIVYY